MRVVHVYIPSTDDKNNKLRGLLEIFWDVPPNQIHNHYNFFCSFTGRNRCLTVLHHGTNTAQASLIKKSFEYKYEVGGVNIGHAYSIYYFVYLSLSLRVPLRLRGSFP